MVAVYISNEKIQAVYANKIKSQLDISRVVDLPLPSGSVLNGKIIRTEPVIGQLKCLAGDGQLSKDKIRVIVNIGAVRTKQITIPNLRNRKYIEKLISESFSEKGNAVYDHKVIGRMDDGSLNILACRAESDLIKDYIYVFSEAGLKLSGISLSVGGVINLVDYCGMLKTSSFVLTVADTGGISQYYFKDGQYRLCGYNRLLAERNTPEYAAEIIRSLFSAAVLGSDISTAIFSGISEIELEMIRNNKDMAGVKCAFFPQQPEVRFANGEQLSDYIFAVSALL